MNIFTHTLELITDVNISFHNNDAGSLHRKKRGRKKKVERKVASAASKRQFQVMNHTTTKKRGKKKTKKRHMAFFISPSTDKNLKVICNVMCL